MTPRQVDDYLQDMLDAIDAAQQFTAGMASGTRFSKIYQPFDRLSPKC